MQRLFTFLLCIIAGAFAPRATLQQSQPASRAAESSPASRPGAELLHSPAPSLDGVRWIDGAKRSVESFRGKVVLIRWWMSGCPYCINTAPALAELAERYQSKGLQIVAIYHPKPKPEPVEDANVLAGAKKIGLAENATYKNAIFLLGVDEDWTALKRYWLTTKRSFTSVSFIIDQKGAIRYVHPGGEYHKSDLPDHAKCAAELKEMEALIEKLLK
ncbi:MAG: peroxiredoxin family protein [Planctomycetota bacterium]